MKVKYNPFSAAKILMALLVAVLISQNVSKSEEVEFEPDENEANPEAVGGNVLAFFKQHQAAAKKDISHLYYPKNSVFRNSDVPMLLWAVSEEEVAKQWKIKESEKVQAFIVSRYGNLKNKAAYQELLNRLRAQQMQEQTMNALTLKGGELIESGLYALVQSEVGRKFMLDLWAGVEEKETEEETEAEETEAGGPADSKSSIDEV